MRTLIPAALRTSAYSALRTSRFYFRIAESTATPCSAAPHPPSHCGHFRAPHCGLSSLPHALRTPEMGSALRTRYFFSVALRTHVPARALLSSQHSASRLPRALRIAESQTTPRIADRRAVQRIADSPADPRIPEFSALRNADNLGSTSALRNYLPATHCGLANWGSTTRILLPWRIADSRTGPRIADFCVLRIAD